MHQRFGDGTAAIPARKPLLRAFSI